MLRIGLTLSMNVGVLMLLISASAVSIESKHVQRISCVLVTECPIYCNVLHQRPLTQQLIEIIRAAHCGFQGDIEMVWCPYVIDTLPTQGWVKKNGVTHMRANKMDGGSKVEVPQTVGVHARDGATQEERPPQTRTDLLDENEAEMLERKKRLLPDANTCGKFVENRIVGGDETGLDQYAWTAMLMYPNKQDQLKPGCGGALINKRYVVTAAHCITKREPPSMVVLGEYDIRNETDCIYYFDGDDCSPPPQRFQIENITIHPGWQYKNSRPLYHDVALLRLDRDVVFHDFVAPICLFPQGQASADLKPGTQLVAAGWGITEERKGSNVKKAVALPVVSRSICAQKVNIDIRASQICAGGVKGKDTCKGDSGGPLMHFEPLSQNWQLAGLVSFGTGRCGRFDRPAIYTWMPFYTDWILKNIY